MYRVSRYVRDTVRMENIKIWKKFVYIYIIYIHVDWIWKKLLIYFYSYIVLNFNQVMFTYYNHYWIMDIYGLNIFEKL